MKIPEMLFFTINQHQNLEVWERIRALRDNNDTYTHYLKFLMLALHIALLVNEKDHSQTNKVNALLN